MRHERTDTTGSVPQPVANWLIGSYVLLLFVTASFWLRFLAQEPSVMAYAWNRDFSSVYVGARAVTLGFGSRLYDWRLQSALLDAAILPNHRGNMLPFVYPAYVAVLLSPLGKLSLPNAFLLWTAINLVLTAWTAKLLIAFSHTPRQRFALLAVFLLWTPLQLTLSHGQFGMVGTLGFTQFLIAVRSGRQWQAGGWLVLGLLKPQLIVFPLVALGIWRCWNAIAAFLVSGAVVFAASFAKLGFWIPAYLRFIREINSMGQEVSFYPTGMQNWRGLVSALLGDDKSFAAQLLLIGLTVASLALLMHVCRSGARVLPRGSALPLGWEPRFGLTVVLGLLSSPYLYLHDWILAAPALFTLYGFAASSPAGSTART